MEEKKDELFSSSPQCYCSPPVLPPLSAIALLLFFLATLPSDSITDQETLNSARQSFLQCLDSASIPANLVFTPANRKYTALLFSSVQNLRTLTDSAKPLLIITPTQVSHVQTSVSCSKKLNTPLRIRSGGHDYEGLSYASTITPLFVVLDLQKLRSVAIDSSVSTAWVQAGATLGELYYAISMKSRVVAFPAGTCPSVGVGGHFSGGGLGTLRRSHGLSIDNIIDARIVNVNGDVLDRDSMGEDLFWALRGGGGASFGVVLSYKIKLVQVPPKVTVFSITKTLKAEDAAKIVSKFQEIAYKLDRRLYIEAILQLEKESNGDKRVLVTFSSLFLGQTKELASLMTQSFPDLKLKEKDCNEMSWIESVLFDLGHKPSSTLSVLLDRTPWANSTSSFKDKSDFLAVPTGEKEWKEIFRWLFQEDDWPLLLVEPLGGRIDEISETETPFPHRKGSLYIIQYIREWEGNGAEETQKHSEWMRRFYEFMTPYVSKNPRGAYFNYRDLDLGMNEEGNTSYTKASAWGEKYFKRNFRKLAQVKSQVDPTNFFRNEQSIPILF